MTRKTILFASLLVVSLLSVSNPIFSQPPGHKGEQNMLSVDIKFSGEFGQTVTNGSGIDYQFWGMVFHEDKVYPSQYWGNFPLYFFDSQVGVTVTITNNGPREKAKVRIQTESYVLRTDGSNGAQLCAPRTIDIEVKKGETQTIDASFVVAYTPEADSGLDRFFVKVLHQNEGQGSNTNPDPALIMVKEGVFCPPKYVKK